MSFEETWMMTVARILVIFYLRKELSGDMEIETPVGSFIEILDYERFPLKCHAYGNLVLQRNFYSKGRKWEAMIG